MPFEILAGIPSGILDLIPALLIPPRIPPVIHSDFVQGFRIPLEVLLGISLGIIIENPFFYDSFENFCWGYFRNAALISSDIRGVNLPGIPGKFEGAIIVEIASGNVWKIQQELRKEFLKESLQEFVKVFQKGFRRKSLEEFLKKS